MPTLLVAHLHFCQHTKPNKKNAKEQPSQRTEKTGNNDIKTDKIKRAKA